MTGHVVTTNMLKLRGKGKFSSCSEHPFTFGVSEAKGMQKLPFVQQKYLEDQVFELQYYVKKWNLKPLFLTFEQHADESFDEPKIMLTLLKTGIP